MPTNDPLKLPTVPTYAELQQHLIDLRQKEVGLLSLINQSYTMLTQAFNCAVDGMPMQDDYDKVVALIRNLSAIANPEVVMRVVPHFDEAHPCSIPGCNAVVGPLGGHCSQHPMLDRDE